eukprot:CAMPEP_0119547430 /NCGR_PEP_ID=MMETSP1352-20130426/1559_1 /TAXON_ID=265584 /ORGANISM="Stauroneis constricta, Strain CCMP1120" /LENGTH=51 /DNA_ID=CAMNT_0007592357 /DNA_START=182 /DNA_END=333 /DNA_ORIENTATION=+
MTASQEYADDDADADAGGNRGCAWQRRCSLAGDGRLAAWPGCWSCGSSRPP